MKATKKQITEVTAKAIELNVSTDSALRCLSNCSLSIYKVIGAEGVVESAMKSDSQPKNGNINVCDCSIIGESEKALLFDIPFYGEKWVAKSVINKNESGAYTTIPSWVVK